MNNNLMKKLDMLQSEKRKLLTSLADLKRADELAVTSKGRRDIKKQYEIVKARLIEFYRVLAILGVSI